MRISDWGSDVCSSDLTQWFLNISSINSSGLNGPAQQARMTGDAPSMAFEPRQTSTWGGANISATALMKKLEYWLESERDNIPLWIRSEEHTSELQSLMRISYAVFCLKHKNHTHHINDNTIEQRQINDK